MRALLPLLTAACATQASEARVTHLDPDGTARDTTIAIVAVNLVSMESGQAEPRRDVIVSHGRIVSIGESGAVPLPSGAVVIDGRDRYLMPGLIDMHTHVLAAADLTAYVREGVTTVRNMWGTPGVRRLAGEIDAGTRVGPTIISASPGVDGTPPQWPGTEIVLDPDSAADVVRRLHQEGWSFLKVYTRLPPGVFEAVTQAAVAEGIRVVGHVPLAVDVRRALELHMASIEHLTGYDRAVSRNGNSGTFGWADADPSRFPALVAATVSAGTWNCPTLAIYSTLAARQHSSEERRRIVENRRRFVRALDAAGARLLVGTDAGIGVVAPGSSLHDELAEFVAAGIPVYRTLRAATIDAAGFLERPDLGVVRPGARADLLLLEANPLTDIHHLRAMAGLVLDGAWMPRRELPP
ncbi:MAG TPA: amidohydrolase family protein [Gemmatimonadales bacterium]|nr:amidohydrolase family protein [Gemmatimonadales bacterium]